MIPSTQLLKEARERVLFPIDDMTQVLYGDRKFYEAVQGTQEVFEKEVGNYIDYYQLSRKEQLLKSLDKLRSANLNFNLQDYDHWGAAVIYFQSTVPASVSYLMTVPAIQYLGTDEQAKYWLPKFFNQEVIAAYTQTEIGHGSDVQNLETTVSYDEKQNNFILHTPSISATKFWPGELGLFSNHALVYAQLIFHGKNKGVFPFMVQIRDLETHKPLQGVIVGDIGPKLGYSTKDNGYLAFNQFRIPLNSLLARYVSIDNGHFHRHGNEKISYASMMIIRKLLTFIYPRVAAQSLTIAIRYSLCRQQFTNDKKIENQVIEYQTQQDKLIPRLAQCYSLMFVGLKIKELAMDNLARVQRKDYSQMQSTHALLSASKAWSSQWVVDTCEWCRLSCGGHGYAHYSGLPGSYFEVAPNVTLEGENQVLYLQVARYLLKVLQQADKAPDRVPHYFQFVLQIKETLSHKSNNAEDLLKLSVTLELLDLANKIKQSVQQGLSFQQVWNTKVGTLLLSTSQRYFEYFNWMIFRETINKANPTLKLVLEELCELYAIQCILDNPSSLIEHDRITAKRLNKLKARKEILLPIIKDYSIGLVDAFKFSDSSLKTTIGCYDGQPYERIYEWATKHNSMNQMPIPKELHDLMGMKSKSKL